MDTINRSTFLKRLGIMTAGGMLFPYAGCQRISKTSTNDQSNKSASKYYIDSQSGDDSNNGTSPESAWKTLDKAGKTLFKAGDSLFIKRGATYTGSLFLNGIIGEENNTFEVASYGSGSLPVINSSGYLAGVSIKDCQYVNITNLEITSDAGTLIDPQAKDERYGVLIEAVSPGMYSNIALSNLVIHDIFANESVPKNGKNATSNVGMGIVALSSGKNNAVLSNISIQGCTIRRTGFTGIAVHDNSRPGINNYSTNGLKIINNQLSEIGGPGMNMNNSNNVLVRSNTVDGSGSSVDPRMHGRGSGIWPWTSNNVLIEHNTFMHARGKADSCGAHIDFNNKNVVIQYNLSYDNEGGFIEILGNTYNCSYRYNISVNDGSRVKGVNGAQQDGHTIWLSNFTGKNGVKRGPFNTYIYNNTVYAGTNITADFHIIDTAEGFVIANNIFDIRGSVTSEISSTLLSDKKNEIINNAYHGNQTSVVDALDTHPIIINDAIFNNPGNDDPSKYVPLSGLDFNDKGIVIPEIPGDTVGLSMGLKVTKDYFDTNFNGTPGLGAIENK